MGASASLTLPTEYEKLSDEEKASFQGKFDTKVAEGGKPEEVFAQMYKETLQLIANMSNDSDGKYDIEEAISKLKEINLAEANNKFAFVGGVPLEIKLTDLQIAVDKAVELGLTPLVIDNSEDNKVDTFYSYGNGVLLDSKKLGLDRTMRKVPLADLMEEARSKLVSALRYGNNLVIVMTKAVTDWNGVFTDESEECQKDENNVDIKDGRMCFPLEVFNNAGLALTQSKYTDHLYRDGEKESGFAVVRDPEKFRVILTTQFTPEDFEEFLFGNDWGMPKPKEKYAFIVVQSS
jgi:hypothetical protein